MTRPAQLRLAEHRVKNLTNYMRFRGFKDFEIVTDIGPATTERIDIHVSGELLYSLPIDRKSKLEAAC